MTIASGEHGRDLPEYCLTVLISLMELVARGGLNGDFLFGHVRLDVQMTNQTFPFVRMKTELRFLQSLSLSPNLNNTPILLMIIMIRRGKFKSPQ